MSNIEHFSGQFTFTIEFENFLQVRLQNDEEFSIMIRFNKRFEHVYISRTPTSEVSENSPLTTRLVFKKTGRKILIYICEKINQIPYIYHINPCVVFFLMNILTGLVMTMLRQS